MRMYVGVLKKNNLEHASGLNLHANKNVTRADKGHVAILVIYTTLKFQFFQFASMVITQTEFTFCFQINAYYPDWSSNWFSSSNQHKMATLYSTSKQKA